MPLENRFDAAFAAGLALREKQIQQNYRPVIGVHKWFARRPGTLFRHLLLAEYNGAESPEQAFFRAHRLTGVIADPFMGGGTPLIEANRLGFDVIGTDINPMACWIVRQELSAFDDGSFAAAAARVTEDVSATVGSFYETCCMKCSGPAVVKYFLWVKRQPCPACGHPNDLFPGYLLAEATRHPKHVVACSDCGALCELDDQPRSSAPATCEHCGGAVHVDGPARRNAVTCRKCHHTFRYPPAAADTPPVHRMWAIEYHCARCKPQHSGRFFKKPGQDDLARYDEAAALLEDTPGLPIPDEPIPDGDETRRLHRWGYRRYRDMFSDRQLLGLGLLLQRLTTVESPIAREALLTVFSDSLRYQNMLCRYDTYALKCQDIFSVHGFPVGLVQCENNLLGIPGVGSGSFTHFVEKYRRAKAYCKQPFETLTFGKSKRRVPIHGEKIEARFVEAAPQAGGREAQILCTSARDVQIPANTLDGVFTDPPYYDNVQYAELIDFCYTWLRQVLAPEFREFQGASTRAADELTGNTTLGRGLEHFTQGLSDVFTRFAAALKPDAPFVFTYHHNDITAYAPIVVALLDAGLCPTAVLPAAAEMEASLHINNTESSILDSVFVCRTQWPGVAALPSTEEFEKRLTDNCRHVALGGVRVSLGDVRCLFSGHVARLSTYCLHGSWDRSQPVAARLERVQAALKSLSDTYGKGDLASDIAQQVGEHREVQMRLFDAGGPGATSV